MSLHPRCLALNQITSLIQSVNKKNFKSTSAEIAGLVERYGSVADQHVLKVLLSAVEFPSEGKPLTKEENQLTLLVQQMNAVLTKPNFISILCHAFEKQENKSLRPNGSMLQHVARGLRLSKVHEVVLALGLSHSADDDLKQHASGYLKVKLLELIQSFIDTDPSRGMHASGLHDVSPEVLHTLILHLLKHSEEELGLERKTVNGFVAIIRNDFPRDHVPVVVAPLLYQQDTDITEERLLSSTASYPASSVPELSELFQELGYLATTDKETVLQHFRDLGVTEVTPKCVARILGMMARTHGSSIDSVPLQVVQDDRLSQDPPPAPPTWNVEVFVEALEVKCPTLSWREVVLELDHTDFHLPDMEGLRIIMKAYQSATTELFPVEALYRMWNNTRGQLSWIRHALSGCPDFSFADFPYREVTVGAQRSLPEDETKNIRAWMSLDLIETLLNLAECGHFEEVQQLFAFPMKHCPNILMFGILQSKPIWHAMQHDLLCWLVPYFMANHPNSTSVLHFAWQGAASDLTIVRQLMSNAIADWYLKTDPSPDHSKLSRVLDITQDLKALSTLLNSTQFAFTVDLACLAAKREYLNLERWISDKIREHQEPFITTCISFLMKRAPHPVGNTDTRSSLNHDIVLAILACLQPFLNTLAPEWAEKLRMLISIHGPLPPKADLVHSQTPLDPPPSLNLDSPMPSFPSSEGSSPVPHGNGFPLGISGSSSPSKVPQNVWGPGSPTGSDSKGNPQMINQMNQLLLMQGIQGDTWTDPISKEAEEQANQYFQAVYHGNMNVDQLLTVLKQFRSASKREREVYACMLKYIFKEYKFFPQFPEKYLQITGQLFGGIIDQGLVSYMMLGVALRNVLESLRKAPGKMFLFGVAALDKFKGKLKDYPQYCTAIANLPHFQQLPLVLQQYVEYGRHSVHPTEFQDALPPFIGGGTGPQNLVPLHLNTNSGSSKSSPSSPSNLTPGPGSSSPLSGRKVTGGAKSLLDAAADAMRESDPPEAVQDKIHFTFNNLSSSNLEEKAKEFKDIVQEGHFCWIARYLVVKRVSNEQNFHTLYMNFLDSVSLPLLNEAILKESFRNIKILLQTNKSGNSFSDRTVLKSLGHWLGMMTLAKNKPLLHLDIALKELLLEAFLKGPQELLYVVPFVAKVLECAAESKVFQPPNPWVMAIMKVLAELHAKQDLKLNLKFEIEVLCKTLSLELTDIKPSQLLGKPEFVKKTQLSVPQRTADSGTLTPSAPQPQFRYDNINVSSLAGLAPHIQVNSQILLLTQYPQLRQSVRPAIEKAVQDYANPVLDRSIKIVLTTTEQIIKKDFALNHDEEQMRSAAHSMVRHLTAGMSMITCREPLLLAISTNLKTAFSQLLRPTSEEVKVMIDQASQQLSADNTELACAFIQKMAVEKAIVEIDKRLTEDYESRKQAQGTYLNPAVMQYQVERMPDQLRMKPGSSLKSQTVYDEFARCLPGFLPSPSEVYVPGTGSNSLNLASQQPGLAGSDELVTLLDKCIQEINNCLWLLMSSHPSNPHVNMISTLLELIKQLRMNRHIYNAITLLQKTLENLLEGMNPPPSDPDLFIKFRDSHILVLRILQDQHAFGSAVAKKQVTQMLLDGRDELKYSARAIILLIGIQAVDMKALDQHFAKAIETGRNLIALSCSIKLINALTAAERSERPLTDMDLKKTKETLVYLVSNIRHLPESSVQLLENFRPEVTAAPATPASGSSSGVSSRLFGDLDRAPGSSVSQPIPPAGLSVRNMDDPPGLHERVECLLSEWVRHYHVPGRTWDADKLYAGYVARLQQSGIFKADELITRFFRISIEMCVDLCYRTLGDPSINPTLARAKCYHTMDAFVKLVVVLVRFIGDSTNQVTKVNLLNKVLVTVTQVLLQDQENKGVDFHQLPYHRFFVMLLSDLTSPDPVFEAISFHIVQAFCNVYHHLKPTVAPGFAYSWLELVSHRIFVQRLLVQTPQQKGWPLFQVLLIDAFTFLTPFLRNADLAKPVQLFYKGTLRVLLVLLHDFPEFLCEYHFAFCDVIPPNCIQMRNLILSAFPRNMRLPDPFTPNLKVETLPDISHAPSVIATYLDNISRNIKSMMEECIDDTGKLQQFQVVLMEELQFSQTPGNKYKTTLMNALTLYLGTQAIEYLQTVNIVPSISSVAKTAHFTIFKQLIVELDTEGRYLLLNAIANQLRYPNSHTHYFSCCLLALFGEVANEAIQEQVTRVLLERLIVNRPHPWGLLITFIELIKNQAFKFWDHEFVHCAPEIRKLFESVARSCMQKQTPTAREQDIAST